MQPAAAAASSAAAVAPAADDVHGAPSLQAGSGQDEELGAVGGAVGGVAVASRDARYEVLLHSINQS